MAALGKILRKGTGVGSALDTVKYERVNQDPSDNEEEDDDVIVIYQDGVPHEQHQNGNLKKTNKNHGAAQSVAEEAIESGLIEKASVTKTSSEIEVKVMGKHAALTRTRIACFVLTFILAIGIIFSLIFILPKFKSKKVKIHRFPASVGWNREYDDYGSESMTRLFDIDEDGRLDIIHALYRAEDGDAIDLTRASAKGYCKQKGEAYPCVGQMVGIRGHDGVELWRVTSHSGIFEMNCGNIDVDNDGKFDCLAAGRLSTILAFDPRNGTVFWRGDGDVLVDSWNVYSPLVVRDLNEDGVAEVIIAHGGDPSFPPTQKERGAGRLILLDGASGEHLGNGYIEMPGDKETYMSPVLHTMKDGSEYVLFGSGGETVPGSLYAISLPDLYQAIMANEKDKKTPDFKGDYKGWDDIPKDEHMGLIEIYKSERKGVMVPPVCVDLNHDGVNDIVMSAYDGNIVVFDGESLTHLWTASLNGFESYSSPAPGYFNDDDVLDLMVHSNEGAWPKYQSSVTTIYDGKTGDVLWSMNSTQYEMTSDLIAMSTEQNRDIFIFRVQGRGGKPNSANKQRRKRYATRYQPYSDYQDYEDRDGNNEDYNDYGKYRNYQPAQKPRPNPGSLNRQEAPSLRPYGGNSQGSYRNGYFGRKGVNRYPTDSQKNDDEDDNAWAQLSPYNDGASNKIDYDVNIAAEEQETDNEDIYTPTCKDNQYEYMTEIFAMDRSSMLNPYVIKSDPALKYHYNVSLEDIELLRKVSEDETEVAGTHYGKRNVRRVRRHGGSGGDRAPGRRISDKPITTCSMLTVQELTSGAIGDVDGDGRLDMVASEVYLGDLSDEYGNFIKRKYRTNIFKINLERDLHAGIITPKKVNATISSKMPKALPSKTLKDIRFRKWKAQPWREYMGSRSNSIYGS